MLSHKEKNKYHIIALIFGIQKNGTDELICKAEIESQMQKTSLWLPKAKGEKTKLGDWD